MKKKKFASPALKAASLFAGLAFLIVLVPVCLLLIPFVILRSKVFSDRYYVRKNATSNIWHWSEIHRDHSQKSIHLEISTGFTNFGWEVSLNGDGEHGSCVMLSAWFLGNIYISFYNFLPDRFMPPYQAINGEIKPWGKADYGWIVGG